MGANPDGLEGSVHNRELLLSVRVFTGGTSYINTEC